MRRRRLRRRLGVRPSAALATLLSLISLGFVGCLTIRDHPPDFVHPAPAERWFVQREIRVRLLGATPVARATLEVSAPFEITETKSGRKLLSSDQRAAAAALTAGRGGRQMSWGGRSVPAGDVVVRPQRDASIVVNGQTYRGTLRLQCVGDRLALTNQVDVESYVMGVLRGELPAHFHPQAQRALAVAARTFALYQKLTAGADEDFDVLSDERSQMYVGVRGEDSHAAAAVADTRGQVCLVQQGRDERVFATYYSSCCGGMTQAVSVFRPGDPAVPPLKGGVPCRDCYLAPNYRWAPVTISKAEITRRLCARYRRLTRLGEIVSVTAEDYGPDGRVAHVKVTGSGGASETLVGEDFRLCMGGHTVKSTWMRIVDARSAVRFVDGKGFGHGVGLCQYGADRRAKLGQDYLQILQFYYPGAAVRTLY